MELYYTPDINDFHYDTEYEENVSGTWEKHIFGHMAEPFDRVRDYPVRTKYLDKEDIESEGWEYIEDRGMSENYGNKFRIPSEFKGMFYELRIWYPKHDFWPGMRVEITGHLLNANFYIKSINELRIIQKFLKIK